MVKGKKLVHLKFVDRNPFEKEGETMGALIRYERSIIPACDVASLEKLAELVEATFDVPGIGGYKVGSELIVPFGLREVVQTVRDYDSTELPVIYDHQKGGTDIPELGLKFAKQVKSCGADAVILFPFGGRSTARAWIEACQGEGLVVLVGGHMTQKEFLSSDGGYIADSAPVRMYTLAAELGVTNFVVPGNNPEQVLKYKVILEGLLGEESVTLFAPGFISQGGDITETGKVAGKRWHAIVGSALYNQQGVENIRESAKRLTSQIMGGIVEQA